MTRPSGTRNPIVPGVIMFEFLWTQDAGPAANILHCQYTGGPPSTTDLLVLAHDVAEAFWTDPVQADYPSSTVFVGVRATDLASDTGAVGEYPVGTAGTAEDPGTPAGCSMMVNYQIARRYRGGHPRSYFPALANGAVDTPGTWDSTVVSDFNTVLAAVFVAMNSSTSGTTDLSGQCCVSYVDDNAYRVDNLVEPVTGMSASNRIRTQRRRLTSSSF